jgi:UDP-glucose 4-epimerase
LVLITGGLGYLGCRIAKHLLNLGVKVRISTSRDVYQIPKALSSCEIVKVDYNDNDTIDNACKGILCVIHLAALNSESCENNPEFALTINVLGVLKTLTYAKKNKVKKFLYFSTSHVYGDSSSTKMLETTCTKPNNHYSLTHEMAENYVIKFNEKNKFNTTVFRLTNIVGYPLSKNNNCWMLIVNDLCKKIATGKKAFVHSNRKTERDFVSMQDVLNAVMYVYEIKINLLGGEVINISSGENRTLESISKLIIDRSYQTLGIKAQVFFSKENNKINNTAYYPNQKALDLGFKFSKNLESEIDNVLIKCRKWFLLNLDSYKKSL